VNLEGVVYIELKNRYWYFQWIMVSLNLCKEYLNVTIFKISVLVLIKN